MLRSPGSSNASRAPQTGVATLDYELAEEMAIALGRAGRTVEERLSRLAAHEEAASQGATPDGEGEVRHRLLKEAAEAVHAYFIQRELCGLKRHDDAIRDMGIPRKVLVRLGVR